MYVFYAKVLHLFNKLKMLFNYYKLKPLRVKEAHWQSYDSASSWLEGGVNNAAPYSLFLLVSIRYRSLHASALRVLFSPIPCLNLCFFISTYFESDLQYVILTIEKMPQI